MVGHAREGEQDLDHGTMTGLDHDAVTDRESVVDLDREALADQGCGAVGKTMGH